MIRSPSCAFAAPSFTSLCTIVSIAQASAPGCRAKRGLPTLLRLRARAELALATAQTNPDSPSDFPPNDDLSHLHSPTTLRRLPKQAPTIPPHDDEIGILPALSPQSATASTHSTTSTLVPDWSIGAVPPPPAGGWLPPAVTYDFTGLVNPLGPMPLQQGSDLGDQSLGMGFAGDQGVYLSGTDGWADMEVYWRELIRSTVE